MQEPVTMAADWGGGHSGRCMCAAGVSLSYDTHRCRRRSVSVQVET